jgi:hypothetical protein
MISTLHFSPTRASTELTARQSSLLWSGIAVTFVCLGINFVPSCGI